VFVVAVVLYGIAFYSHRKSINEKEGVSHQYGSPCGICVGSAHSKSWHEFSSKNAYGFLVRNPDLKVLALRLYPSNSS
jgi:hypothetical protein